MRISAAGSFGRERDLGNRLPSRRLSFPQPKDFWVDDEGFIRLFKPNIDALSTARAVKLLLPEYVWYRVEEYAARSRGKAVAGVGHTLAGHRESGTLHCFVVGSIASLC